MHPFQEKRIYLVEILEHKLIHNSFEITFYEMHVWFIQ